jgi:spore germination protein KB
MERISTHQFMILSAGVLLGTTFFPVGAQVTGVAGRDGWMAILIGYLPGIPFGLMLLNMITKHPNMNLLEISEKVLGKWLGKGLGICYILITTYFGAVLSGQGFDLVSRTIMPFMSQYIFLIVIIPLFILLYFTGIEVMARFSEVVFPILTASILLISLLTFPRFERGELFPILAEGITPVLKASLKIAPLPMEYILFLAGLLSFLPRQSSDLKQMKKGIWRAVLLVAFLDTVTVLIQIITFGPFETMRLTYGLMVLAKMIEVSNTVTGLESIFALIWLGAYIIKVGAFFYAGLWGLKSVFGLKNKKWSFIYGLIYATIMFSFSRGIEISEEIGIIDNYLILPFTFFWVLMVWGVDKWRSRPKSL